MSDYELDDVERQERAERRRRRATLYSAYHPDAPEFASSPKSLGPMAFFYSNFFNSLVNCGIVCTLYVVLLIIIILFMSVPYWWPLIFG